MINNINNQEILYERKLEFDKINNEDLNDLLVGLNTGLAIICDKLIRINFNIVSYKIDFSKKQKNSGEIDYREISNSIVGGFNLSNKGDEEKEFIISFFQTSYKSLFNNFKEKYQKNPYPFSLDILIKKLEW